MWVNGDAAFQLGLAPVRSPKLRERQEEALLRREAVDGFSFRRIFGKRTLQSFVGDAGAAEVSDIFAERQLAVHFQTRQRFVAAVLINDFLRAPVELLPVLIRPPIIEIALGVVLP